MSALIGGVIGGIIAFLIGAGFKNVQATKDQSGNTVFTATTPQGENQQVATLQKSVIAEAPYAMIFELVVRLSQTTNKVDNSIPDAKIDNPFNNQDCLILDMEGIFDGNFSAKGGFRLQLNTQDLVSDTTSTPTVPNTSWKDANSFTFDARPNGLQFKKNDVIKVWLTSTDGITLVSMTLSITFGVVA